MLHTTIQILTPFPFQNLSLSNIEELEQLHSSTSFESYTKYIYINIYCPWNEWVYENDAQPVLRRMLKEGRKEGRNSLVYFYVRISER
jgi:hypothetical protein